MKKIALLLDEGVQSFMFKEFMDLYHTRTRNYEIVCFLILESEQTSNRSHTLQEAIHFVRKLEMSLF